MCTLIILRRPGHAWPLLIAGNRDEMRDRPWMPPGRHWKDRAEVVAGLDRLGGGSWLGVNDHGMVAAVMNREGTLGPAPRKRSRGELVLEALHHAEARDAVQALADLEPRAYRAFNLFVGDPVSALWLRSLENSRSIEVFDVPTGLHMLSARELDDQEVPRIRVHLPKFKQAKMPNPEEGDWNAWQSLLSSRRYLESDGPHAAMNVDLPNGFGTVCSHLVAIPRYPGFEQKPLLLFANGPPDCVAFERIAF
jgi:uncharacterized protein with NRDE domain